MAFASFLDGLRTVPHDRPLLLGIVALGVVAAIVSAAAGYGLHRGASLALPPSLIVQGLQCPPLTRK